VVENLPSKCEVQSSNPSATKTIKNSKSTLNFSKAELAGVLGGGSPFMPPPRPPQSDSCLACWVRGGHEESEAWWTLVAVEQAAHLPRVKEGTEGRAKEVDQQRPIQMGAQWD
jgi:hypothetical protein